MQAVLTILPGVFPVTDAPELVGPTVMAVAPGFAEMVPLPQPGPVPLVLPLADPLCEAAEGPVAALQAAILALRGSVTESVPLGPKTVLPPAGVDRPLSSTAALALPDAASPGAAPGPHLGDAVTLPNLVQVLPDDSRTGLTVTKEAEEELAELPFPFGPVLQPVPTPVLVLPIPASAPDPVPDLPGLPAATTSAPPGDRVATDVQLPTEPRPTPESAVPTFPLPAPYPAKELPLLAMTSDGGNKTDGIPSGPQPEPWPPALKLPESGASRGSLAIARPGTVPEGGDALRSLAAPTAAALAAIPPAWQDGMALHSAERLPTWSEDPGPPVNSGSGRPALVSPWEAAFPQDLDLAKQPLPVIAPDPVAQVPKPPVSVPDLTDALSANPVQGSVPAPVPEADAPSHRDRLALIATTRGKTIEAPVPAVAAPAAPFALDVPAALPLTGPAKTTFAEDEVIATPAPVNGPLAPVPAPTAGPLAQAPLPGAQPMAQLAAALSNAQGGATEISLAPEELGRVKLRLQADAQDPDRMILLLSFDRAETLDLFRRHADQLAEAIRSAGYAGVDIGFAQQDQEGGQGRSDRAPPAGEVGARPAPDTPTALLAAPNRGRDHSGLDLRL